MRAAELDISVSCVVEGVFTLCLLPITVVVVQQSVGEVGGCSLDIRVRYCRVQRRCRRRGSDWKSGRASVELVKVGWPPEVVEPRRADRGGGDVRSGGGAEAADAANPLRAAVR